MARLPHGIGKAGTWKDCSVEEGSGHSKGSALTRSCASEGRITVRLMVVKRCIAHIICGVGMVEK